MSVAATVDPESALQDPQVAEATRAWFAAERAMSDLAIEIVRLQEDGEYDQGDVLEATAGASRERLHRAARKLDEVAGEQLAARLRRLKEEDVPKATEVEHRNGTSVATAPTRTCKVDGCGGKILAHQVCGTHYHRVRDAIKLVGGSWEDAAFVARALAGEFFTQEVKAEAAKPGDRVRRPPTATIPEERRAEIREAFHNGESQSSLAERFDLAQATISRIVRGGRDAPKVAVPNGNGARIRASASPAKHPRDPRPADLCDRLKEKLVQRAAIEAEIRDLLSRLQAEVA